MSQQSYEDGENTPESLRTVSLTEDSTNDDRDLDSSDSDVSGMYNSNNLAGIIEDNEVKPVQKRSSINIGTLTRSPSGSSTTAQQSWVQRNLFSKFLKVTSPTVPAPMTHSGLINPNMNARPSGLPAKDPEEEKKQMQLIQELNKNYQEKLIAEAMQQKQKKKEKMKREEFMRKATDIWLHDIIPNFSTRVEEKRTRKMWRQGLPPRVRGQIWQLAVGNSLQVNLDLFNILLKKKAPQLDENVETVDDMHSIDQINRDAGNINLIKIDLSRTFPALQFFQEGGPFYESFQQVLECYAKFRPDVGYVQGMSYLVAMLLLYMEMYPAFVTLANMLNSNHFYSFFRMNTDEIEKTVETFRALMKDELSALSKHFEREGVNHQTFIVDWYITLFAKSLPLDIAARLWDIYFLEGDAFLYRATLGILKYFEPRLIKCPFEDIMSFLSRLNQVSDIDENLLFDCIDEIQISKQKLEKVKEAASYTVLQRKKKNGGAF